MSKKKDKPTRKFTSVADLFNYQADRKPGFREEVVKKGDKTYQHHRNNQQDQPAREQQLSGDPPGRTGESRGGAKGGGGSHNGGQNIFPLPEKVAQVDLNKCQNFSLLFHRFIPYKSESDWAIDKPKVWKEILAPRGNDLLSGADINPFLERQAELAKSLQDRYGTDHCRVYTGITNSRLSIGFGNTNALETGLTLHRLYGLPYLPGTAIKGLCRAWKLDNIAGRWGIPRLTAQQKMERHKGWKTPLELLTLFLMTPGLDKPGKEVTRSAQKTWKTLKEHLSGLDLPDHPIVQEKMSWEEALSDEERLFCRVFGSQDSRGKVTFYDAYPEARPEFELDIINVHYQQHYDNPEKPAADYLSPVPNYFLTVKKDVRFRFILSSPESTLLDTAAGWLEEALSDFGIGAKTAVGYGEITLMGNEL